ncbi:MAG: NAD(+) diphosphatase [Rhodobacteraceae bacterium]|nr:NAD(+) diphosphatase [Paracoccaceae bacterium]
MTRKPLTYSGVPLDRAAELRADADRIARLLKSATARFVPVWTQRHLIAGTTPDQTRAVTLEYSESVLEAAAVSPVFLGFDGDTPWFALGLKDSETPPQIGPGEFRILNEVVSLLPAREAATLAYARAMVIWHANHMHCGRCGSPAASTEGGHSRTCTNSACGHRSFPRTDPAVITLIEDQAGERALMGRQAKWVNGMYSTIAGFVEPGESLEESVMRETYEETGVRVADVRYLASQPWPFPASIMLGFRAKAVTTEINLVDDELEDCQWFTREDLRAFGKPGTPHADKRLPNPFSISRFLVDTWLAEKP